MNNTSAIILQGQLRYFNCFFNKFNENISKLDNKFYFFNFQNSSDIDKISDLELRYNPNTKNITEAKTLEELINYFNVKEIQFLPKHLLFQLYYWHTSFLLVKDYQEKNNVKFNNYFRTRTDIVYLDNPNFTIEDGVCYVPTNKYYFPDQICDFCILTKDFNIYKISSEIGFYIDEIINSFKSKNKKPDQFGDRADKSIPVYCSEQILFEYFNIKNIKTKAVFNMDLARHFK